MIKSELILAAHGGMSALCPQRRTGHLREQKTATFTLLELLFL
jgi:hypothetical protein